MTCCCPWWIWWSSNGGEKLHCASADSGFFFRWIICGPWRNDTSTATFQTRIGALVESRRTAAGREPAIRYIAACDGNALATSRGLPGLAISVACGDCTGSRARVRHGSSAIQPAAPNSSLERKPSMCRSSKARKLSTEKNPLSALAQCSFSPHCCSTKSTRGQQQVIVVVSCVTHCPTIK